jgi:two-component system LytT family response regulator
MIHAVIIDDEKTSREALKGLLSTYYDELKIIGEADCCKSGIELINKLKPQIVFLDIQMPDGSGFRLLEGFIEPDFHVIFTTAFDQYAIKAIRFSALDYLLKPIDPAELKSAVIKAVEKCRVHSDPTQVKVLMENIQNNNEPKKIVLSTYDGLHVRKVSDIIRCESDDYYTRFFFTDKTKIMLSKTLKDVEEMLHGLGFIRTHKSHLINISFIKSFIKTDGGYLLLNNGEKIPVSRRKKESILNAIGRL